MAHLSAKDMVDLVAATRGDATFEGTVTEIASRLQDYSYKKLLAKDKLKIQSGPFIKGNLLVDHNHSAQMAGLHEVYEPDIPDLAARWRLDWRHAHNYWGWERREMLMNRRRDEIFDIIKMRRAGAKISLAELFESQIWSAPTDSSNDLDLFGIPWWFPKAATNAEGFNGGNPSGFSDCAGIDCTDPTYARWKSYNAAYAQINEHDLLDKMGRAYRKIGFKSPVDLEDARRGTAEDYRIFMNEVTLSAFEKLMRARNDNLSDLAEFMGTTSWKKRPLTWVPKLDTDTSNPVFMLNFQWISLCVLDGDFPYEHDPAAEPNQPNSMVVHEDYTMNLLTTNRRAAGAVLNLL